MAIAVKFRNLYSRFTLTKYSPTIRSLLLETPYPSPLQSQIRIASSDQIAIFRRPTSRNCTSNSPSQAELKSRQSAGKSTESTQYTVKLQKNRGNLTSRSFGKTLLKLNGSRKTATTIQSSSFPTDVSSQNIQSFLPVRRVEKECQTSRTSTWKAFELELSTRIVSPSLFSTTSFRSRVPKIRTALGSFTPAWTREEDSFSNFLPLSKTAEDHPTNAALVESFRLRQKVMTPVPEWLRALPFF